MFSTAIVIFRETIEISLLLGIVLAATHDLEKRGRWIAGGFIAGGAGAGLVALFAESISAAASGVGQEIFNAGVLFTAALFIGWTALWMRKHARHAVAQIKKVGQGVSEGVLPLSTLAVIIGLSMLREGSEIVLFVYGMTLSGQSTASIVTGCLVGLSSGAVTGALLYTGLLRMSPAHVLKFTGWMLILLVAGLASQGAGYLSAAGFFSGLSRQMWDSGWLVSDGGLAGKALHSLLGYRAQPTEIEVIFYTGALLFMLALIQVMDSKPYARKTAAAALAVFILTCAAPAFALDKISSPIVAKGEVELEYSGFRTFDSGHGKNNVQGHEIALGYGATDRWATEVSGIFEKEPDESFSIVEAEWENTFQFFEQGEKWADTGAIVAYIHAFDHHAPDALEVKLLAEKQTGSFLHRANLGLEQELGANATGGPGVSFLWSSRYRHNPYFEPGVEIQSDFGKTTEFHGFGSQEHYAGPAAYGELTPRLRYEAAWLAGVSSSAAASAARVSLEYELFF